MGNCCYSTTNPQNSIAEIVDLDHQKQNEDVTQSQNASINNKQQLQPISSSISTNVSSPISLQSRDSPIHVDTNSTNKTMTTNDEKYEQKIEHNKEMQNIKQNEIINANLSNITTSKYVLFFNFSSKRK